MMAALMKDLHNILFLMMQLFVWNMLRVDILLKAARLAEFDHMWITIAKQFLYLSGTQRILRYHDIGKINIGYDVL